MLGKMNTHAAICIDSEAICIEGGVWGDGRGVAMSNFQLFSRTTVLGLNLCGKNW